MLCVLRKGFQLLVPKLLNRDLFDDLLRDDFGFDVVLVGLGAPEDTPDELPPDTPDNVVIDPFPTG